MANRWFDENRDASPWLRTAFLAGACLVLSSLSLLLFQPSGQIAMVWGTNAVAAGLILRWDYVALASRLATAFLAILAANLMFGEGLSVSVGLSVANAAEISFAVLVLRLLHWHPAAPLSVPSFLLAVLVAGVAAPLVGALIGAEVMHVLSGTPFLQMAMTWWARATMGVMAVLPLLLSTSSRALPSQKARRRACIELVALTLLTAVTVCVTMYVMRYPFIVVALPILLAASRVGARGAAVTALVATATYMAVTIVAAGPDPQVHSVLAGYLGIALATIPPFLFGLQRDALVGAERGARESEALFSRAMKDSAVGMALVRLDGGWLRVNDSISRMLGYTPDELSRLTFQDITHPDDLEADLNLLKGTLAGEFSKYQMEKRYIRKDGRVIWGLLSVSLVRDVETGAPQFFISQIQNITDRKEAEEALTASEERSNFALESASQGAWDRNFRTGDVYRSPYWHSIFGYAHGELSAQRGDWLALIHPDDLERFLAADRETLEGRAKETNVELRLRKKNGDWLWVLHRGRVIERDTDGRPVRVIGTHTDISRRKQREEEIRIANERIALAVDAGRVGIWELDLATTRITWAPGMYALYGVTPGTFDGTRESWARFVHPEDIEEAARGFNEGVGTGGRIELEFRIVREDGEVRYIRALAQVISDADGKPIKVIGTQWDTTDDRALANELYEEKERLRITLHSIGDAVITTDASLKITYMNPIAETLSGWTLEQAEGLDLADVFRIFDDETNLPIPSPVEACMTSLEPYYLQDGAVLLTRSGAQLHIQDSAAPVRAPGGEIIGAVLIFQDVTRTRILQKELIHAAHTDSLTGLPNRLAFEQALTALCSEARAKTARHALCFIDLDRFKIVNDTAGHTAGDALLVDIGKLLRSTLRAGDQIARIGGDEFALLLPNCSLKRAQVVGEHLVDVIRNFVFHWDGHVYDIGASIGITEISGSRREPAELMKEADVACYAAKSAGRGQVSVYHPDESDAERHHREINIAAKLRMAIDSNRMTLFGQEIVSLGDDADPRERHIEILIRMRNESGELLSPGAFIPAAERYGMMAGIDRWVIVEVLTGHAQAFHRDPNLSMSINLSANSLDDPLLWPFVYEQLTYAEIPADRICFEITETALINNLASATFFARSAKQHGCRISLDDFGVGLSSFSYLKDFRVDELKIDGSFIRQIEENNADTQIVEAMISVGKALGIDTVAEWVEGPETLAIVKQLGADRAQGYYISPPKPLTLLLAEKSLPADRSWSA
jgi:diguanylate cyclase (GGDEF)-like protein/PAS domain S-box-containing protein